MIRSALEGSRFISLTLKLVGEDKGRGADRKRYGDAVVRVVLKRADYSALVAESLAQVQALNPATVKGDPAIVAQAVDELTESFRKTLAGESVSTSAHVYAPVMLDGEVVPGAKVYIGGGDPTDPRSPVPGTLYLQGACVSSKILVPAPNGPVPPANSSPVVAVKNAIRRTLPIAKWKQYRLLPGDNLIEGSRIVADGSTFVYSEALAWTEASDAHDLIED